MQEEILRIKSISELHALCGFPKPFHPLISIIDVSQWEIGPEWLEKKMAMDLYTIALKDASCGLNYGRNAYDFNEGVLIFTAPNQVTSIQKEQQINEIHGWIVFIHPDLIRHTDLGNRIDDYGFFSYDVHEALHLSEAEQNTLYECVNLIKAEIKERVDNHSQRVIVSTLELLLNYSMRYYERQFNTRTAQNIDTVSQFEKLLKRYYKEGKFTEHGSPSIDYFAEAIHLSPKYLSDLLKKQTGIGTKDHINNFIVDKAKTLLLSDADSVSGIAYKLGFNYPHYFSRLFKSKTGMTPNDYRNKPTLN
ncbi:helix-turn-helix domain-containing protein [Cyclobacterium amurskyense]|uniref:Transcriptional regulator, AraC family n=1 Tax=Cyclobacterium amurskyense TaxID=320787 RepID=A0A0H4PXZ3_9BACT|nr:helix-turn-helix domain-containing protein [Cyclobacterium amurskyense]AKP53287.1 Transcriptional regulator, AraC family [Cyclobacterium amurskyense]|tara:strand:+ start:16353 stop:17270 length:918 start_codon:yes stop_codon:yes gene_type:complete